MNRVVKAAAFLGCLASAAAVKLELLGAEHERIAGEYIIEYHDDASSKQLFEDHLKNWKGHFENEPTSLARDMGFQMIHARLSDEELAMMETLDEVKHISHNRIMRKSQNGGTQNPTIPSLDRIDAGTGRDGSYTYLSDGTGVDIFILDTGCDCDHPGWGADPDKCTYLGDCAGANAPRCITGAEPRDEDGHGTHVAGTSASPPFGVAKGATVRCVRVLGADGSGSIAGIINGINLVVQTRAAEEGAGTGRPGVINMSLGGGRSNQLNAVASSAANSGTIVVVAAGNEAQDASNVSPASANDIITVGSSTRDDVVSSFSNSGPPVDIFAVGSNVQSLRANTEGTLTISGTSMASPHVAGACAQLLSVNPELTAAQVLEILTSTASAGQLAAPQGVQGPTPNLLLNVADPVFGTGNMANLPNAPDDATQPPTPTQAPVPDSARCLSTVDAVTTATLRAGQGLMFDIFATNAGALQDGMAPSLESITFFTTQEITEASNTVATVYSRTGDSYRTDGAPTNADQWDLNMDNSDAQIRIVSSGQTTVAGQQVFTNVAVLPQALELTVNARNGIYINVALDQFDVLFNDQVTNANQGVATDGVVIVAPGRAIGQTFSTNAIDNRLPLVQLCYSPVVASQAIGAQAGLDDTTTDVSLSDSLDCITSTNDDPIVQNVNNGIMFDLVVNDLTSADLPGVFLESFSVFLMDTMEAGVAEVWTTRNGASYEGQENNPDAWVLLGSINGMDMGLSVGDDADMVEMTEDGVIAPERPATPELLDIDFGLSYELRRDNTPQGFYVTFQNDNMQYYSTQQNERVTVAMNSYVSMTGGKGVQYPFGGTANDQIFDMRQFSGQACFSTGRNGASSAVAAPVTIVVGVIASVLLAVFN